MNASRFFPSLWTSLLILGVCLGQAPPAAKNDAPQPVKKKEELKLKHETFTFVRIKYTATPALPGRRGAGRWATDYPDSDVNLTARVAADTGLKTDPLGKVLELTDPELKEYPFIYLIEAGNLSLTDAEAKALREYLTGGGFLMVDDFWGEAEWAHFQEQFKKVFPAQEHKELPLAHPLFHCFYDLKSKPQVPSIHVFWTGRTTERDDAPEPHYRGLTDDKGRLLALICHNTDLGDGWERADLDPKYFREMSQRHAYPLGVNIVVYALSQ